MLQHHSANVEELSSARPRLDQLVCRKGREGTSCGRRVGDRGGIGQEHLGSSPTVSLCSSDHRNDADGNWQARSWSSVTRNRGRSARRSSSRYRSQLRLLPNFVGNLSRQCLRQSSRSVGQNTAGGRYVGRDALGSARVDGHARPPSSFARTTTALLAVKKELPNTPIDGRFQAKKSENACII